MYTWHRLSGLAGHYASHNSRTVHPQIWDPSHRCDLGCLVSCQSAEGCRHQCNRGFSIVRLR